MPILMLANYCAKNDRHEGGQRVLAVENLRPYKQK